MNVNALTNPIVLKMMITFVIAVMVFVLAVVWIRGLRKEIIASSRIGEERPAAQGDIAFSLAAYNGVIQKLKEQENELQRLRQSERGRAATSERKRRQARAPSRPAIKPCMWRVIECRRMPRRAQILA